LRGKPYPVITIQRRTLSTASEILDTIRDIPFEKLSMSLYFYCQDVGMAQFTHAYESQIELAGANPDKFVFGLHEFYTRMASKIRKEDLYDLFFEFYYRCMKMRFKSSNEKIDDKVMIAYQNLLIQQLEYMRSFLIGKLGWATMNALPNISGGFGMFDTDVVVKSGGYDQTSMAEDMDMLLRMVTYMKNNGKPFRLAQVPQVCCWTEGPSTLKALYRQRTRWARGLCEIITNHRQVFFNPHYGPIGAITLPYVFIFEFIAPTLELFGQGFMIWLLFAGGINWGTAFIIFGMIYVFCIFMSFMLTYFDYKIKAIQWHKVWRSHTKLIIASMLEPFIYHPLITIFSNIGYWRFLMNTTAVWKPIQRTGVKKREASPDKAKVKSEESNVKSEK
jgi:hypothetical protein